MKKTELKKEILNRLAVLMQPVGFVLVKRMDWYIRKGTSSLIYGITFYDGYEKKMGYTVASWAAVRISQVEQIYHQVSGFEPKYQKDTPTIGVTTKDLRKGDDDYEYSLDSYEDIEPLAETLFDIFRDIALPFLEENSSVEPINTLLNVDLKAENSIFCIPEHRYFRGVIIAKLAKDNRYDQIVEIYRNELLEFLPNRLVDFDRLLNILDEI